MAASEQKKNIMAHIARTSSSLKLERSRTQEQPVIPIVPVVPKERKSEVMDHIARSTGSVTDYSMDSKQRKRQIMDHIRASQGQ